MVAYYQAVNIIGIIVQPTDRKVVRTIDTVQPTHEFHMYKGITVFTHLLEDGRYTVVEIASVQLEKVLQPYLGEHTAELSDMFDRLYFDGDDGDDRFDPTMGGTVRILLKLPAADEQQNQVVVYRGLMTNVYHIPQPR